VCATPRDEPDRSYVVYSAITAGTSDEEEEPFERVSSGVASPFAPDAVSASRSDARDVASMDVSGVISRTALMSRRMAVCFRAVDTGIP